MKKAISQFYSLFREAMFANRKTAADISAAKGVHYTYVYNSIRNNANLTLQTADDLATAAGYHMVISFEALPGSEKLIGGMDPQGPLFSERRSRKAKAEAEAPKAAEAAPVAAEAVDPATALDEEISALLADV